MLRIYEVLLVLVREVRPLLERLAARDANLGDQCRRALSSARSLREVLACLEVGEALGYLEPIEPAMRDRFDHVIGTLVKIVK